VNYEIKGIMFIWENPIISKKNFSCILTLLNSKGYRFGFLKKFVVPPTPGQIKKYLATGTRYSGGKKQRKAVAI